MIGVISGYRTGSTTLIQGLTRLFKLNYNTRHTGELDFTHSHYYTPHRTDIIYKFMPGSLPKDSEHWERVHEDWLSKSSLVFSLRHDISAQIKSYALANVTGIWHTHTWADDGVQEYNNANDTNFTDAEDIATDIAMNISLEDLDNYRQQFSQNLTRQNELYQTYGGIVSVLEDRFDRNEEYSLPFRYPEHLLNWHCGFELEDYFTYK